MQEILFAITQDGNTERVGDRDLSERCPFIESTRRFEGERLSFEVLPEMKSPRLIKTHMQREFFDNAFRKNAKFVVVNRDPKDVLVSYYHFNKMIASFEFDGDFNAFFELFKNKKIVHGDWFDWVLGWWEEKDNPNVHFVTYEAMKKDIVKETRRVAKFLGKDFTDEVIQEIVDSCSLRKLKEKRMESYEWEKEGTGIYRKGIVGDWITHFTPEQAAYIDELYRTKMANIDFGFEYWYHCAITDF